MLAILNSCAFFGMKGYLTKVEVDVSSGLPSFDIVGLPDASIRESKERVRAAIRNSDFEFPLKRITVNLAPADIKKAGPLFDLAIAAGILAATDQIPLTDLLQNSAIVGEISLEGAIRPVPGVLSMADQLKNEKEIKQFFVPKANAQEAALISELPAFGVKSLNHLADIINQKVKITPETVDVAKILAKDKTDSKYDMAEVKGQESAKRALLVAAAGGHNILLKGSPGSGKTMLARRFSGILPDLTLPESLEITKIYSISGLLPNDQVLFAKRPFRAPHHSASAVSVIGGGQIPKPGEASLAHGGVLFLDELPEFNRDVLESLRQPLEDRIITISRASGHMDFLAGFQLVSAMNPCPCGYYGDPIKECSCTPYQIQRYVKKISGPLLDRIDMHIDVPRVKYEELTEIAPGESSQTMREKVSKARTLQQNRFANDNATCNAQMGHNQVEKFCTLRPEGEKILKEAFARLSLSARSYDRILKVARTIADLDGAQFIEVQHLAEALQYRSANQDNFAV